VHVFHHHHHQLIYSFIVLVSSGKFCFAYLESTSRGLGRENSIPCHHPTRHLIWLRAWFIIIIITSSSRALLFLSLPSFAPVCVPGEHLKRFGTRKFHSLLSSYASPNLASRITFTRLTAVTSINFIWAFPIQLSSLLLSSVLPKKNKKLQVISLLQNFEQPDSFGWSLLESAQKLRPRPYSIFEGPEIEGPEMTMFFKPLNPVPT
jgi:hypothetical protein